MSLVIWRVQVVWDYGTHRRYGINTKYGPYETYW